MQHRNAVYLSSEKTVEGTYNGHLTMRGDDGLPYAIPHNYASKSRLIEGDRMTLYILRDGTYQYKVTKQVDKIRFQGTYIGNDEIEDKDGRVFKVLHATVTYYRLEEGEQVCCVTTYGSEYCAVESLY